jgi:hypothetical protein
MVLSLPYVRAIKIPDRSLVDQFLLSPIKPTHVRLDPEIPWLWILSHQAFSSPSIVSAIWSQEKAKNVIDRVDENSVQAFGRSYGGLVELQDGGCGFALVAMGKPCPERGRL